MSAFRTTWVRPFEEEPLKPVSAYNWPLYSNPRYNRELTKFMFSFRDESSTNRNINNLMFITGPELAGKSWLLRSNLKKFDEVKSGTYLIHIDLADWNSINFESFLDIFESKIVEFIVSHAEHKFNSVNMTRWEMVSDLLVLAHDRLYLDVKLTKILASSIKNDEYLNLNASQKSQLGKWMSEQTDRQPQSTPVVDSLEEIILIISRTYENLSKPQAQVRAALDLALAFYRTEESASCPSGSFKGVFRSGLKTSWFLLDILNLVAGFHELNVKEAEYPHLLLVLGKFYLEKASKLLEIETNEDRPVSWIESIALKLHVKLNRMTSPGGTTFQLYLKLIQVTLIHNFMMT